MFVVVGRFRFQPMAPDARQRMVERLEQEFSPVARECRGLRSVRFVQLADDELLTDWHWDRAEDWEAAQPAFAPFLRDQVVPLLAGPPDRVMGDVVLEIAP